jgi:hypothetical protein
MLRSQLARFAVDLPLVVLAVVAILSIVQACTGGAADNDYYNNYNP